MNITKTGQIITDLSDIKLKVNNFTETRDTTGWTFGGTSTTLLADGTMQLEGTSPTILSPYFPVGPKDIIAIEFTVSLPTPSSPGGAGKGLYLGSPTSQGVYVHTFNHSAKTWSQSTSANNNPYYLQYYNLTTSLTQRHYFLGSEVDLNNVPQGETTNTNYPARAIQLPPTSTVTQSRIRSGYNTNPEMIIWISNVKIYNITQRGFYDGDEIENAAIGKNFINGFQIIEY